MVVKKLLRIKDKLDLGLSDNTKDFLWFLTALIIGIVLVIAGLYGFFLRYMFTGSDAVLPDSRATVTSQSNDDLEGPSEEQLSQWQIENYSVANDQPRSIKVNSVGIFGLVQKVGITGSNALAVPNNIYFAGWYENSPSPGRKGLSIIDGHVRGTYKDAIFKRLGEVKNGDEIAVEYGDRRVKKFKVFSSKRMPVERSAQYLFYKNPDIESQLNIITCDGSYDKTTRTYKDRVVVSAKLII